MRNTPKVTEWRNVRLACTISVPGIHLAGDFVANHDLFYQSCRPPSWSRFRTLPRTYCPLLLPRPIRTIVLNKQSGEHLHSPTAASTRERSIARRWISVERIAGKRDCKKKSNFCVVALITLIVIHSFPPPRNPCVPYSHASKRRDSREQEVTVVPKRGVVCSRISSRSRRKPAVFPTLFPSNGEVRGTTCLGRSLSGLWKCCLK